MTDNKTTPGVERTQRISDDGLARLEKHLISGSKISRPGFRVFNRLDRG